MKVHFLGTNGWFNTATGETSCVLIDAHEAYVIFDAGNALRKIDRHITDTAKPIVLFLSHFHLDHTYGLHLLAKFRFAQGITIVGQKGLKKHLKQLLNSPWSSPLKRIVTPIRLHEVREGTHDGPVPFQCRFLVHADLCLGFRVRLEGKTVTYCTDTGTCDGMTALARDADLFIAECAWRKPNQSPQWPHLAPEDGATVARQAHAKQLALLHFEASGYPTFAERDEAETRARTIFPNTHAMRDDGVILL